MRLIDADALRNVLADCPVACGPYAVDAADAAPTVCCENCLYSGPPDVWAYGGDEYPCAHPYRMATWHKGGYGCSLFKRYEHET